MLCITLLFEGVFTRKAALENLGEYLGRYIGGISGGVGGAILSGGNPVGVLGGAIGGGIIGSGLGSSIATSGLKNPNSAADFSDPTHRMGYLAKAYNNLSGTAALGNLGGFAAWAAARAAGHPLPYPLLALGVGGIGSKFQNAVSDEGAKKIGYGIPGRVSSFLFGPYAGLIPPSKVAKNK